ncbi:MAG: HAD hydrolase-like protein, partial [Treponema sp.]|nr:HAD hydrolase-like protein [Treponema sp.]
MKFTCVIFDLDGTLVDTLDDIANGMNRALEFHGFAPV